ncbi:protein FAM228B isoform X2 [Falco cherrug]|uniref:protein FAM228B isoform X2 n=1 Tax=Falco cherrug TaxID=345164 RepID=UPI002479D47E|nr:protein FAM228B isoform X2 [Falco cherrug]
MAPRALPGMLGAVVSRPVRHRPGGAPGPALPFRLSAGGGTASHLPWRQPVLAPDWLRHPSAPFSDWWEDHGAEGRAPRFGLPWQGRTLVGLARRDPPVPPPCLSSRTAASECWPWSRGVASLFHRAAPALSERLGVRELVQGFTTSLSQKNRTALSGGKSAKDGLKQKLVTPLQTRLICSVNNSETPWLPRFTCPRLVREHDQQSPWQRFSSAPAKSGAENTFECSRRFGKENNTKDLLPQRDFCRAKRAPDEDIIASVQCILDRESYFVREVDTYLRHSDFLNLRKKEILYKKWLEDVSEPLLQKIEHKMDSQSSKEIQKRKEEQLSLYLDYCKKKGYVALETYDPSEYDPFFLKTHTDCWKVSIPPLQDPLLKDIQRKLIETGIIKQCETGRPCSTRELNKLSRAELPQLPLGRQGMDAAQWLKVPHAYIASEVHQRKRQELMWCLLRGSTTATVDEASPWLHSRVFAKT